MLNDDQLADLVGMVIERIAPGYPFRATRLCQHPNDEDIWFFCLDIRIKNEDGNRCFTYLVHLSKKELHTLRSGHAIFDFLEFHMDQAESKSLYKVKEFYMSTAASVDFGGRLSARFDEIEESIPQENLFMDFQTWLALIIEVLKDGTLDQNDLDPIVALAEDSFDLYVVPYDIPYIPQFAERRWVEPILRAQIRPAITMLFENLLPS